MINDYAKEMFELQMELKEVALQLEYCNWDCVNSCSGMAKDLMAKSKCLKQCRCLDSGLELPTLPTKM